MKVLALIPARGGSKGLPGKNIRPLKGKPLIAWTILAAQKSKYLDKIVVSTDSQAVADVANAYGVFVPTLRPAALATDEATSLSLVEYIFNEYPDFEAMLLLQPTSPLRGSKDIDALLNLVMTKKAGACVSVNPIRSRPEYAVLINDNGTINFLEDKKTRVSRRQDLPPVYEINGAMYFFTREILCSKKSLVSEGAISYLMDEQDAIDIDTLDDFLYAEFIMTKRLSADGGN